MDRLRQWDRALARAEAWGATGVLLAIVLAASAQALFFNLANRGLGFAATMLEATSWVDTFAQKGTLILAFLGASLATHEDKHFSIDVLPALAPRRVGTAMRVVAALASGVVAFLLAFVFYRAGVESDATVPFAYEVLTPSGAAHVCDAPAQWLGHAARPSLLCALRAGLAFFHVPVSSGGGIAQLLAPIMLVVIGIRLIGRAIAKAAGIAEPATAPRG